VKQSLAGQGMCGVFSLAADSNKRVANREAATIDMN